MADICCIRLTTLQARYSKTKTQLCSLLQFLTTDKRWYPPVPEWKGLLLPASRGERPIIDGGRTPVAYSNYYDDGRNGGKSLVVEIALGSSSMTAATFQSDFSPKTPLTGPATCILTGSCTW